VDNRRGRARSGELEPVALGGERLDHRGGDAGAV
jgi:hypothetical protein